ncbi:hypothetical protein [Saccharospirillum alexandrii]|uniref:hypothetical protein n=1 Tax=Saccharospirillum alexandrii TaxID=2448477 RepID=UPI003735E057
MIEIYRLNQPSILIKADIAGEFPIYLYVPNSMDEVLYSKSINELLNHEKVSKPLEITNKGISFLLQSGVIPPPNTIYKSVYVLGMNDEVELSTRNGIVNLEFKSSFPFSSSNVNYEDKKPDENRLLELVSNAAMARIDSKKPTYLFHSAGKDSNTIALAIAEAGLQSRITLVSHKSKGLADESEISKQIAKKLGFKHKVLNEVDNLRPVHRSAIKDFFKNSPFPSTDSVTLAYPLYLQQLPTLAGANVIDGGGNDSYMMTPPTKRERRNVFITDHILHSNCLRRSIKSESLLFPLTKTRCEWFGTSGFSYSDSKKIMRESIDVNPYWVGVSSQRKDLNLIDLKTSILTQIVASEVHIRKVRNFADSVSSNLILPFANEKVAMYVSSISNRYLFDVGSNKNKLVLRKILKDRIDLDSDIIGKMGYEYDTKSLLLANWDSVVSEIERCKTWNQVEIFTVVIRLKKVMHKNHKYSRLAGQLLYRLYIISIWLNENKYIKMSS